MNYKEKTECRCCGSKNLYEYLDLGNQPLANSYKKVEEEELEKFPLKVNLCLNCYNSQLSIVVNPNVMFKNYLYVNTASDFLKHQKELAEDAVQFVNKENIKVLDIACNSGDQLSFFKDLGCQVMGIDPAENLRELSVAKNIDVVVGYFPDDAHKLNNKFDIITATNVVAHTDNLLGFFNKAREILNENGVIIIEFPYCKDMLQKGSFDIIYHEHLSTFTVNAFKTLVNRCGLFIRRIVQTPIHGGSIRFYLDTRKTGNDSVVDVLVERERRLGLFDIESYKNFTNKVNNNVANFISMLHLLKMNNIKVVGYAAAAKTAVCVNYAKLDSNIISYVVDNNSIKWNYIMPGNIYILPPEQLAKETYPLGIVVFAWNFYDEIVKKIKNLRPNSKDYIVRYVPNVAMEII